MKRLLLILVLLMTAGSLFAAELKITGDATVRGSSWSEDGDTTDYQASWFDLDFDLNAALLVNEKATVNMRLTYDKNYDETVPEGSGSADDVGLAIERAFINYKFAPFLQLNTGLMGGGQWASEFGNTETNQMRVQFIGALSADMIFIATYEKQQEEGYFGGKDSEDNDFTVYYLSSIMKFNQIKVLPLVYYGTKGLNNDGTTSDAVYDGVYAAMIEGGAPEPVATGTATAAAGSLGKYDVTLIGFQLGLEGDFGMFGFVFDSKYEKYDADGFDKDWIAADTMIVLGGGDSIGAPLIADKTVYGFMIDVYAKVDALKAGLVFAYGSSDDEDGSFNFGDDFDMFYVMDDYVSNSATGLEGFSAFKLYADYTMDKLTVMAALGYGYSNGDGENGVYEDATFMEADLGASYAFDANTTYTVGFGYAQTTDWDAKGVDDDYWRLFHKVSVKF